MQVHPHLAPAFQFAKHTTPLTSIPLFQGWVEVFRSRICPNEGTWHWRGKFCERKLVLLWHICWLQGERQVDVQAVSLKVLQHLHCSVGKITSDVSAPLLRNTFWGGLACVLAILARGDFGAKQCEIRIVTIAGRKGEVWTLSQCFVLRIWKIRQSVFSNVVRLVPEVKGWRWTDTDSSSVDQMNS